MDFCTGDKLNVTVRAGTDDLSSLCGADDTDKMVAGADVTGIGLMELLEVETFSGSFGISLVSLAGTFNSVVIVFIASVGTFKREVVVAVLNVTDVLVDRFMDGDGDDDDDTTPVFDSSSFGFSLDFLSSATILLL